MAWFLFFHRLADRDLWSSHEARAGQNAASILHEGCWGLPKLFDGTIEMQKPPLYYWLVALAAQWRDAPVDAWAVRLPAALSAVGGVLLVFAFLALRGRPMAGLLAAIILATALHYTWLGRTGRIDMPLTLCTALAVACFYLANSPREETTLAEKAASQFIRNTLLRLLGCLAIAAGVLLKGPIGAVLPITVLLTLFLLDPESRRPRAWLRSSLWWGIPLILALVLPWYLWADAQTGGKFFQRFFWYDNFERAFGEDERLASYPFWFYLPRFLFDFLPWSPLLLIAGWFFYRRQVSDPEARLGLVWLASIFVLLSLVRFKRGDYLLPAYPGAAIFLGCMLERACQTVRQPRRLVLGFAAIVAVTLAGWWVFLHESLPAHEAEREQQTFAAAIRAQAPAPKPVLFFRAESHLLAFHLGWPLFTFLEWENLDVWAGRPGEHWIVMPPDCAAEWPQHVSRGKLEEVLRTSAGHEHPLVLMRIRNLPKPAAAE